MKLDPKKTGLITLDFQRGILESVQGSESVIPQACKAVEIGRKNSFKIIHIGLGFSTGHPELPNFDFPSPLLRVKQNDLFVKGSGSGEFHKSIVEPNDLVIYKQRISAFSEHHLQLTLRTWGIQNLVFFGISTSGVVLSTLRQAFDLDFRCTVVQNACYDMDPEVHRVLTEKVFPKQAKVIRVESFEEELNGLI